MTHFLSSDQNPNGHKLEDVLRKVRNDIIYRATKIMDDSRPEAQHVLNNNIEILGMLAKSISLAEDSTMVLNKSFGTSQSGSPRIGKE
ncbi:MAG: histidine kinase [Kordiimonadaceae bacterium]|nr:histidine kinase [Kordiimonadaceae bacterium]